MVSIPVRWLFVVCAVLSGGCVHIERYPQSWEPLPPKAGTAADCADIAGTYANEGENAAGQRVALASWLKPGHYPSDAEQSAYENDLGQAQTVQLQLTANILTIVASAEKIRREWSFDSRRHEFECQRGVIGIHAPFEVANDIMLGVSKGSQYLYRVRDHLVISSRGGGVGLVFIVPIAAWGNSWGRFAVTPSPAAGNGAGIGPPTGPRRSGAGDTGR